MKRLTIILAAVSLFGLAGYVVGKDNANNNNANSNNAKKDNPQGLAVAAEVANENANIDTVVEKDDSLVATRVLAGVGPVEIKEDGTVVPLNRENTVKWRDAQAFVDNFQLPAYMVDQVRERGAALAEGRPVDEVTEEDMLQDAIALDSEGFIKIYLGLTPKNRERFEALIKETIATQTAEI